MIYHPNLVTLLLALGHQVQIKILLGRQSWRIILGKGGNMLVERWWRRWYESKADRFVRQERAVRWWKLLN